MSSSEWAETVDVGGVDKGHTGIEGSVERGQRNAVVGRSPVHPADGPCTEADARDRRPAFAQSRVLHRIILNGERARNKAGMKRAGKPDVAFLPLGAHP
jgi:hypothetical protein